MSHETIILINDDDKKEGFFTFSTSKSTDFNKLCKRVKGQENLLDIRVSNQGSIVTNWTCKIPIKYLSKVHFGIGQKKRMTDEQRKEAAERLKKLRKS